MPLTTKCVLSVNSSRAVLHPEALTIHHAVLKSRSSDLAI